MTFIKNTSRFSALLLLAVFTVAIVPKELWHHCEGEAHHRSSSPAHFEGHLFSNADIDCPVCDFQVLPFFYSFAVSEWVKPEVFSEKIASPYQDVKLESFKDVPTRGPPAVDSSHSS